MVTTRFAPSPTGFLHVGNLRTAVFNWLTARKAGGRFLLRIDDTDATRSEARFVDAIKRDLDWLGLDWDGEFRQSDRLDLYRDAAARLKAAGRAYDAFETPEELELKRRKQRALGRPPVYDRAALRMTEAERARLAADRAPHLRFLLDQAPIEWEDLIRGAERVDGASISDPVLIREDGQILYTLASVLDDAETGVSHVIRGADHVTNTGAQIQIFAALGAAPPAFGHCSLLTDADGGPLSKRLGALAIWQLREAGVEPLALRSFLARLGSADPIDVVTDPAALVASFDLKRFGRAPTKFDAEDLHRHSAKTLRALPLAAVAPRLAELGVPEADHAAFWEAIGPNLDRWEEAADWWRLCRDGTAPVIAEEDRAMVAAAFDLLPPRPWGPESWAEWTKAVKAETGRKGRGLFQPLRRALTGRDRGPEMAALMPLLRHP